MKGDVLEVRENIYVEVEMKDDGTLDLSKGTFSESLIEYANGLPVRKIVLKDLLGRSGGAETIYYYNPDHSLAKIELISLSASGKKRVWKSHELLYENGQLVTEHGYYDNGTNLRGTFHYTYSKGENGSKIVDISLLKPSDPTQNGKYHIEYDAMGNQTYSSMSAKNIIGFIFKVLKHEGTTREYIQEVTQRGKGEKRFITKGKEQSKMDAHGNTESKTVFIETEDPKTGEEISYYTYFENIITYGVRKKSELDGLKNFITEADLERKRLKKAEENKLFIPDFTFGSEREEPPKLVEEMPRFPGCEDEVASIREKDICSKLKLQEYIAEHLVYPKALKSNRMEGDCTVQFVVNVDGTIDDIEIIRSNLYQFDEEALRIFKEMNENKIRWTAGKQRGRVVRVYYSVPIEFKLSDQN